MKRLKHRTGGGKKQAPKNTAGTKQRHDHPKKPAPATKKAKKESSGPRPSKFEIPPEIKTAWSEIDHVLVEAQTDLFIRELKKEKKVDLEVASMGAIMPEEVRPELDRINRELFEEAVEAMFLAYKYERKVRKKQETPEFLWAVFFKGLAPFILQRKDIARPLLKHWLSRITVEAAGLEHEAESQPSPDSQIVKPSEKRASDVAKQPAEVELPERVLRGEFCDQVVSEIIRVKFMWGQSSRTLADIKNEHPDFAVWHLVARLSEEDQETFRHPGTWGCTVGYAHTVLAKRFNVVAGTIKNCRKAYRRHRRQTRGQ